LLQLHSVTPEDVEEWLLNLRNRFSEATANRALTVLKIMLKEAKRRGLITRNPAESVEKPVDSPREKGILTLVEFRRLFDISQFQMLWDGRSWTSIFTGDDRVWLRLLWIDNVQVKPTCLRVVLQIALVP
jgi:site-specific recombinase XerD